MECAQCSSVPHRRACRATACQGRGRALGDGTTENVSIMRSGYSSRILLISSVPMPLPVPPPSECATWKPASGGLQGSAAMASGAGAGEAPCCTRPPGAAGAACCLRVHADGIHGPCMASSCGRVAARDSPPAAGHHPGRRAQWFPDACCAARGGSCARAAASRQAHPAGSRSSPPPSARCPAPSRSAPRPPCSAPLPSCCPRQSALAAATRVKQCPRGTAADSLVACPVLWLAQRTLCSASLFSWVPPARRLLVTLARCACQDFCQDIYKVGRAIYAFSTLSYLIKTLAIA